MTYVSYTAARADPRAPDREIGEDVSDRYHDIAKDFDSQVNLSETLMGIGWLRSRLVGQARGNVLEVAAGTGRNSGYFDLTKCTSITMLDQAAEMTEIAKTKFKSTNPGYKQCRFVTQSAHDVIKSPPTGYDTVVQTMGICSTANPVGLLKHLGAITNPQGGRILLLEHGRSYYSWLNNYLDTTAERHASDYGCWYNKDIGKIIAASGLEVVKMKRYHFGTTWWIELRPRAP